MARRASPLVTLLTDFGLADGYVGAIKGVLCRRAPGLTIVDLSHEIAPFDIHSASVLLASAAYEFPAGTIHVAIVDPGVGSARRILIADSEGQRFVVPDNGVLDVCRFTHAINRWFHVTRYPAVRHTIAPTFHGRDIFAPVAAALARGVPPARFGPRLTSVPLRLPIAPVRRRGRQLCGHVLHVDRFGTLVTTIDADSLRRVAGGRAVSVRVGRRVVHRWVRTYAEAPRGMLVAVVGSQGWLEISVVEGSAARVLRVARGAPVTVERA